MGLTVSQLYGDQVNREQALRRQIGFNTHVALPAVVQSYNSQKQTVEAQPTVRERIITPDNQIQYVQYPLLINVPVIFPQVGNFQFTFPISQGDECLIIFSDVSIDNWWLKGNVQNPVEQRRHDLSDGMAIFGLVNQSKLQGRQKPAVPSDGMAIINTENGVAVGINDGETGYVRVIRTYPSMDPESPPRKELEEYTFLSIINKLWPIPS